MERFDGVKVFSATKATERDALGGEVTRWLAANRDFSVISKEVLLSSDAHFHCITIILFYKILPPA